MSLPNDPNGYGWHEPRCETCKRFDADCACVADAVIQRDLDAMAAARIAELRAAFEQGLGRKIYWGDS